MNPTIPTVCIWSFGCYFAVLWEGQGGPSLRLKEDAGKWFKPIIRCDNGTGLPAWLTPVELCTAPLSQVCFAWWKENSRVQQTRSNAHRFFCILLLVPKQFSSTCTTKSWCRASSMHHNASCRYVQGWRLPSWRTPIVHLGGTHNAVQGTLKWISSEILI